MRKLYFFLVIIFILCTSFAVAQNTIISGKVTDIVTGEHIPGVMVIMKKADSNAIYKYAVTSNDGVFEIKTTEFPQDYTLKFSMMGYETKIIAIKDKQSVYNVQLSEKETQLKEVIIKAPSIRQYGDTITYQVSRFANEQDKSLADVLKKMPGIEIVKNGQIRYNGIPINKFYIEGEDMLGNRYGLATENIQQKDVASIEVMENHQPIKALEDMSFSQNPAINIKLRNDAKSRWVGTAKMATGGYPFLWDAELVLMRFKKESQTLNIYKTNNSGKNIVRETEALDIEDNLNLLKNNYQLRQHIYAKPTRLAEIEQDRSRFNKTHVLTTNNLWAVGENKNITSQITYANNIMDSENSSRYSYFLNDSTIITDTKEYATERQNRLLGNIIFTANTPDYYIRNNVDANIVWDNTNMDISGSFPNSQIAKMTNGRFSNDLNIIKRFRNRAFVINSFNLYNTNPSQLSIKREQRDEMQKVNSSVFYSHTNTSMSFFFSPVTLSLQVGVIGVSRKLESDLSGVEPELYKTTSNNMSMNYLNIYANPNIEYSKNDFEAKLNIPISLIPYRYNNYISSEKDTFYNVCISPNIFMKYVFSSHLYASLNGGFSQRPISEQLFHEGLIMNNYRNLSTGFINHKSTNNYSASVSINYRNPLKAFFSNISVSHLWEHNPYVNNRIFYKDFLINSYKAYDNRTKSLLIDFNIGKSLDIINGLVSMNVFSSLSNGNMLQNGERADYKTSSLNISPKINTKPIKWCNIQYELLYSGNSLEIQTSDNKNYFRNISQILSLNFTPGRNWYFQIKGEYYHNEIAKDYFRHFFLADASFTYNFKNGWEINLLAKNIFNQKSYSYSVYDGLTGISREYAIRPINIMAGVFFRF